MMMYGILLALLMAPPLTPSVSPTIGIYDVHDLTFSIPNYVYGQDTPRQSRKENETELFNLLDELFGDEYDMRMWNGHLIVKEKKQ